MNWFGRFAICGLLAPPGVAAGINEAWAQTGNVSIYGEVIDQGRQVVPGATVSVTHDETGTLRATVTDGRALIDSSACSRASTRSRLSSPASRQRSRKT